MGAEIWGSGEGPTEPVDGTLARVSWGLTSPHQGQRPGASFTCVDGLATPRASVPSCHRRHLCWRTGQYAGHGLSVRQLAAFGSVYVSRIESGQRPVTPEKRRRLGHELRAKRLGI